MPFKNLTIIFFDWRYVESIKGSFCEDLLQWSVKWTN